MGLKKKTMSLLKTLGPGFITGAADDDPSGIATYSIAGARYGYALNWMSLFLIPMMIVIQEMCGRIGLCTGMGLVGAVKKHHSRLLLIFIVFTLTAANVINIGADLAIMASCLSIICKLPMVFLIVFVTGIILVFELFIPYKKYAFYLKWLAATLLVYVATAIIARQNWGELIIMTLIPKITFSSDYIMTLVGFIGTTISPYLFFWQAAEEVEEEIAEGRIQDFSETPRVYARQVKRMNKDTVIGMVFSNIIASCIIITAAATLFRNGIYEIATPQEAAMALRPLAGDLAFYLFSFGIIAIGLQSIPILAGSVAYSWAELIGAREGLGKPLKNARFFYFILFLSTVIGAIVTFVGINPIKFLFYSAVFNGIVSIPLIVIVITMAKRDDVVGKMKSSPLASGIGWATFVLITVSVGLLLFKTLTS